MWCHCHCNVLWWAEEGDGQFWGSGRGAIAGCHSRVLWLGGGNGQFWRSGRGHCWVPLLGGIVVRYGGGMPLLCVIVGCHCSVLWLGER